MNKEEFLEESKKIGITLTKENLEKLEQYMTLLMDYTKHTNLTSIKDEKGIYLKHFYDSLTINKYIHENDKVLDIGTGAGFPGAVLAILNPKSNFTLLDSNNKKISFLKLLKEKLDLNNIELVNARAEDYVKNHLEEFDIVTSRAVAELRILLELSLPALKVGGLFLPLKSSLNEELANSKETMLVLNGKIVEKIEFLLPIEKSKRTVLIIEHFDHTNNLYPRRYDKILKKPLKKTNK